MQVNLNLPFVVFLLAVVGLPVADAQQLGGSSAAATSSGTLNLVLANKNGFVIAADSRMSNPRKPFQCNGVLQFYCDNSQKLFKTGKESAMVIAGFAAGGGGTPLDLVVASVLRRRFGPGGHRVAHQAASGEWSFPDASEAGFEGITFDSLWARITLAQALTGVASLYDPSSLPPESMIFVATFAEIGGGKVALRQQKFIGSWVQSGPLNRSVPHFEVSQETTTAVEHWIQKTVGIKSVADAILGGSYKSGDPVIVKYYQELHSDVAALDSMSVTEMEEACPRDPARNTKFYSIRGRP